MLGLESAKDTDGNVIQEAPLPDWANFRQRALDIAVVEITKKTDLKISIKSLERSKHRRVTSVTFAIEEQAVPDGDGTCETTLRHRCPPTRLGRADESKARQLYADRRLDLQNQILMATGLWPYEVEMKREFCRGIKKI